MKFNAATEWQKFEEVLIEQLKAMPLAEFGKAWPELTAKTQFYGKVLLPEIAKRMECKVRGEFLRCDHVILNKDDVPVVFVECENNHRKASEEIDKLCAVSSPVRVLFLSCEWAEGERDTYLPDWKKKFETHHRYFSNDAFYMIVVGEWRKRKPEDQVETLYYHIESFDITGRQISRKEVVRTEPNPVVYNHPF